MERQGLTFDDIDKLNRVIFYEGYVDLDSVGGLAGSNSADLRSKDWRTRVHLERKTVGNLYAATDTVARALQNVLAEDDLFGALDDQEEGTRRVLVGMLLLLVRDAVTGNEEFSTGVEGREILREKARRLLHMVETDSRVREATFARFLKIDASLPIRTDGLMSIPVGEMFAKTKNWFVLQQQDYTLKAQGLDRILRDKPVPEDFRIVFTTVSLAEDIGHAPGLLLLLVRGP